MDVIEREGFEFLEFNAGPYTHITVPFPEIISRLAAGGLGLMEPFCKHVEAKEANLRALYDDCAFAEGCCK